MPLRVVLVKFVSPPVVVRATLLSRSRWPNVRVDWLSDLRVELAETWMSTLETSGAARVGSLIGPFFPEFFALPATCHEVDFA